jgi:hypothetical protein
MKLIKINAAVRRFKHTFIYQNKSNLIDHVNRMDSKEK